MKKSFLLVLIAVSVQIACSAEETPKPPEGRCESHDDCLYGNKCIKTHCQDIYHPRGEIKNY